MLGYIELPIGSVVGHYGKWLAMPDIRGLVPETRSLDGLDIESLDLLRSRVILLGDHPVGRIFASVEIDGKDTFLRSDGERVFRIGSWNAATNSVKVSEDDHLVVLTHEWVKTLIGIMDARLDTITAAEAKRLKLIEKDVILTPKPWLTKKPEGREIWISLKPKGIAIDKNLTPHFDWYFATESSFPLLSVPEDCDIVASKPGFAGWFTGEGWFRAALVPSGGKTNSFDVVPLKRDGTAVGFRYGTASEFDGELAFFDNHGRRISMRVLKTREEAEEACLENETAFTAVMTLGEVREAIDGDFREAGDFAERNRNDIEEKGNESLWRLMEEMR